MGKYKNIVYCVMFLLLLSIISGCSEAASIPEDKITVAVSIIPQETFVKAVAGGNVDVITLIPPGKSPENYSPPPQQMEAFSKSSIYFSIGVPSEDASILPKAREFNQGIKIIHLADRVAEVYPHRFFESMEDNLHSHEGRDPHIWLSPKRVSVMIDVIAEELSSLDSKNSDIYLNNAKTYKKELETLDEEIKASLKNLPAKTFIVYHPSFGYFADDYGLKMLSLEDEGKKATITGLQNKIDTAKREGIKVIFYQAEMDSKQAKVFARELGGKAELLEPLSPQYIENLKKTADTFADILE